MDIYVSGDWFSFFSYLFVLEMAGHTELGAEIVGALPAVLQRCIHVYEREKEKGFTVFPKDALNLGFF